jgi:hypothetical protein
MLVDGTCAGCAGRVFLGDGLTPLQQTGQLGDIRRNPPRLILGEQFGG